MVSPLRANNVLITAFPSLPAAIMMKVQQFCVALIQGQVHCLKITVTREEFWLVGHIAARSARP
jgi:hypothetical protein